MALQKTITLDNGLEVSNSYIRIDALSGSKNSLTIQVNSYISIEYFSDGKSFLNSNVYTFTPSVSDDSANFIKQGYVYLKTLSDFSDAIDC